MYLDKKFIAIKNHKEHKNKRKWNIYEQNC